MDVSTAPFVPLDVVSLDELSSRLLELRAFRVHQLDLLEATRSVTAEDPARDEIRSALASAARSVVLEIDAALQRVERGSYGRCRRCGLAISHDRLQDFPATPTCWECHR